MEQTRIGNIHIQRIVELEEPFIPVGQMFPDSSADREPDEHLGLVARAEKGKQIMKNEDHPADWDHR